MTILHEGIACGAFKSSHLKALDQIIVHWDGVCHQRIIRAVAAYPILIVEGIRQAFDRS